MGKWGYNPNYRGYNSIYNQLGPTLYRHFTTVLIYIIVMVSKVGPVGPTNGHPSHSIPWVFNSKKTTYSTHKGSVKPQFLFTY